MQTAQRRFTSRAFPWPSRFDCPVGSLATIAGYAAVFYRDGDPGTEYVLWPGVVERIMPTAFDRAIAEDDVRGLFDHDSAMILGRSKAGTLRLSVDSRGLRYEIDPPDTQAARDLIQSIQRGDITGSSFGFVPRATAFRDVPGDPASGGVPVTYLERTDVQLFDVGPVAFPAYTGTEAGLRAHCRNLDAIRDRIRAAWGEDTRGDNAR